MKSDINLLTRRKTKKYSGKKLAFMLVCLVLIGGAAYAAVTLPAGALAATKLSIVDLDNTLNVSSNTEQELREKTLHSNTLKLELNEIKELAGTKSDVSEYLEAVEASLPTTANITHFDLFESTMEIIGIADNDQTIAAFCVRLRETGVFNNVFITSSAKETTDSTMFTLTALLPVPLDGPAFTQEEENAAADGAAEAASDTSADTGENTAGEDNMQTAGGTDK